MQTIAAHSISCDGCGQTASPEHIARRIQRLEWTTRYRPIHIGTLLLGGISPAGDENFLYAGKFAGEAGRLLEATGISQDGKPAEAVLSEFQRGGFLLTYVMECSFEDGNSGLLTEKMLLVRRLSSVAARIRRSLKPKRVVLLSDLLVPLISSLTSAELGCAVILDDAKPFGLDSSDHDTSLKHLREALKSAVHGL